MSKAYPCVYCTDDLKCTKYTDDKVTSFCVLGPCHDEKPSNADRIRAMSDEELAKVFDRACACPPGAVDGLEGDCQRPRYECRDCWLEWLKKEADNG